MKKLLLLVLTIVSLNSYAQDELRPWAIGVGINTVDISQYGVTDFGDQIFNDYIGPFVDTNTFLGKVYVARYLNRSLTLDGTFTYNKLKKQFGESEVLDDLNYYGADLGLRYDVNNIIGETGWFDPYARIGLGFVVVDKDLTTVSLPAFAGFGFNTWFNDKWGLNFETNYKSSAHFDGVSFLGADDIGNAEGVEDYHFQHSISIVYKFGAKDTDKDGVPDKEDMCPELAGPKELFGCPDTDGDGIADKDDLCPELAGSIATKGCPDSDGDGVADNKDECPNEKGSKELNGCPDSDGDGIADKDDKCPTVAGDDSALGCPDSDGDGVADSKDKCPDVAGTEEYGGCAEPELLSLTDPNAADYLKIKGETVETVEFKFDSFTFKLGVKDELEKVLKLLSESKISGLHIEGHTDSVGTKGYNEKLSLKRANAVVDYLVSKGVDKSKLYILGLGESKPKASNGSATGRAQNRRVEISILELKKK